MTKENIIDNIARLNSETWRDREEVRMEIEKLLSELKKAPVKIAIMRLKIMVMVGYIACFQIVSMMKIFIAKSIKSEVARMSDAKLTVDAIAGLQEEIERLKRVNKVLQERVIFLENNKPCKDCASNPISEYSILENESKFWKERIEKIEQIVDSRDGFYLYDNLPPFQQIKEVLKKE